MYSARKVTSSLLDTLIGHLTYLQTSAQHSAESLSIADKNVHEVSKF